MKILKALASLKVFFAAVSIAAAALAYETLIQKDFFSGHSSFFYFSVFLLLANISSCLALRLSRKPWPKISFVLIHSGVIICIFGFIMSSFYGFEGEIFLYKGQESNMVSNSDAVYKIPFRIRLENFYIEYYNQPSPYIVLEDGSRLEAVPSSVIRKAGLDCRVEEFLNDFVLNESGKALNRSSFFNNPAVKIGCKKAGKKESAWIFANLSSHNGNSLPFKLIIENADIKDYKSVISILYRGSQQKAEVSVNSPAKFNGYKIYQTSYEPSAGESSVLTVKKDNWLWLVFLGFFVLAAGVIGWIL